MTKLSRLFARPAFHLLLFCICAVFLVWPFLTIADGLDCPWAIIAYLFSVWLIMIILLFLISRNCRKNIEKTASKPNCKVV